MQRRLFRSAVQNQAVVDFLVCSLIAAEAKEGILHVVLEQCDQQHDPNTCGHAQDLEAKFR